VARLADMFQHVGDEAGVRVFGRRTIDPIATTPEAADGHPYKYLKNFNKSARA